MQECIKKNLFKRQSFEVKCNLKFWIWLLSKIFFLMEEIYNFVHKEEEPYINTEKNFPNHKKKKGKKKH